MRMNLQSLVLAPAALALAAFTAQPAAAESHNVTIPFNFVAAGKVCPAGDYRVIEENGGGTVRLVGQNRDMVWILFPGNPAPADHRVVLSFDSANRNYILRTVQFGGEITARLDKKNKEKIPAAAQVEVGDGAGNQAGSGVGQ